MAVSAALPPPASLPCRCAACAQLSVHSVAVNCSGRHRWLRQGLPTARSRNRRLCRRRSSQAKTLKDVFEAFCSFGAGGGPVAGLEGRMFSKSVGVGACERERAAAPLAGRLTCLTSPHPASHPTIVAG